MARHIRVQYPGTIYHVMCRGDRREALFLADADRELRLETLEEEEPEYFGQTQVATSI